MYALPTYLADDGTMSDDITRLMRLASLVLTVPVVFYSAAARSFAARGATSSCAGWGWTCPIALGIGVAFAASVYATLAGGGAVYFDSIAMFVFFLLCGRYLEQRARHKAAMSLEYLDRAIPLAAHRLVRYPAEP